MYNIIQGSLLTYTCMYLLAYEQCSPAGGMQIIAAAVWCNESEREYTYYIIIVCMLVWH